MERYFYSVSGIVVLLLFFLGVTVAADNLIVPGIRAGTFILGKTTERDIAGMPKDKGLDFQFSKTGTLDSVVVTSRDYQTDRGVRVGATEEDVLHAFGKGRVGNIDLKKGETVIGKVGDKVLFYPGIEFVFAKQQVWAIILVRK